MAFDPLGVGLVLARNDTKQAAVHICYAGYDLLCRLWCLQADLMAFAFPIMPKRAFCSRA